jgi:hypothetical protein
VALVREQTILTERQELVNEVSDNICGKRARRGQRNGYPRSYSRLSAPESKIRSKAIPVAGRGGL